ncbi:REP-associated tyrosine transposase [Nodularia spumigena]|uniref:REP-associated tyrosine transposase n=1 Tax=Nodularia spumigena TaxID=70799 RepID=UPI002B203952|nr:non-canonical purine NTP pyrophosphatase [Nodularia spumigena]MEA5612375.1 non-canonical purine NTP pyrophosphatase [Nodularia spumigena UHCC 0040]
MTELVLATQNPGKIAELRDLLAPVGLAVLGLDDLGLGDLPEPEETGQTFEANATIKALAYARISGRLCLADDSGLEVDALDGRPGVVSSHFAFDGRTDGPAAGLTRAERDAANNARLLRELEGVPAEERAARFVCVMVLAGPRGADLQSASPLVGPTFSRPLPPPLPATLTYDGRFRKHERRLPHWQKAGGIYFVTFRVQTGTLQPAERDAVLEAVRFWHGKRCFVDEAVVMPDHVHIILRPLQQAGGSWPELSRLIQSIKTHSAKVINAARGRTGQVWQREYFDRIIRDRDELFERRTYVWNNPVKAGLCEREDEYPYRFSRKGVDPADGRIEDVWSVTQVDSGRGSEEEEGRLKVGPTGGQILAVTTGAFEGRIGLPGEVPRGTGGFGYDPLFLAGPDHLRTGAELDKAEKNRLSHRGAAVRAMTEHIRRLLPNP